MSYAPHIEPFVVPAPAATPVEPTFERYPVITLDASSVPTADTAKLLPTLCIVAFGTRALVDILFETAIFFFGA